MDNTILECLAQLIELDIACAAAYEVAAGVCRDEEIKGKFDEFRGDHERHVSELGEIVRSEGYEPAAEMDAKGAIIKAFTMLAAQEERTAVLAMRGNEELSNNAYASALQADLPEEVRELVLANFQDERRHMAWMRNTVVLRGWDVEQPEIREAAGERPRRAA